jgi:hypothetical protein
MSAAGFGVWLEATSLWWIALALSAGMLAAALAGYALRNGTSESSRERGGTHDRGGFRPLVGARPACAA